MPLTNVSINFTAAELNIVAAALHQMPYGQVAPLIDSINKQIAAAQQSSLSEQEAQHNASIAATAGQ